MTGADRQRRHRLRLKRKGLTRIELFVPKRYAKIIKSIERDMRDGTVSYLNEIFPTVEQP